MNAATALTRLRPPDTGRDSGFQVVHDALVEMLDSFDPAEDVTTPLVEMLLSLRSSVRVLARDLGLLGTVVNVEDEQAAAEGLVVVVEPD